MSLKYRIALTILILEALMIAAILWQSLGTVTRNIEAQHHKTESVVMTFLADSGKVALITGEYEDFHLQLGNILQDPHIDSVFILKPDGRVAASNRADSVGGSVPEPRGRPHLDSRRQDITANDLNIGTVVAWFSNAGLVASIDAARRRGIQIAIAGMIGIAIVGLFIGFALSRRLEKLAAAADQYVVGGLSVEVDAQGRDETARLARSFRTMAARIQDHVVKLGTELERTALGQKALADSEARYRGLFEGAWLGIQITLLDGTRLLANQALVGLLGYCSVRIATRFLGHKFVSCGGPEHRGLLERGSGSRSSPRSTGHCRADETAAAGSYRTL